MSMQPNDMVPVPIREFLSGSVIPVDLYIQLSSDKFVMVAKRDSKAQLDQLMQYQNRAVEYLYVRREDYAQYVGSSIVIAGVVIAHHEITSSKKADFLSKAAVAVMQEIELSGVSPAVYEHARIVSSAAVTLVEAKPDLFNLLLSLNQISDEVLAHSVAVSMISCIIGKGLGWTKRNTFEKVALGGLLHDIGKKEIPAEVLAKGRAQLSQEELALYESHPYRGLEILRSIPSVPDDVVSIVYEHHENAIGQGFPRRLRDVRMNPLARIVALADAFANLTIKSPNGLEPKTAIEAVNYIEHTMGQPFSKEAFAALRLAIRDNYIQPRSA